MSDIGGFLDGVLHPSAVDKKPPRRVADPDCEKCGGTGRYSVAPIEFKEEREDGTVLRGSRRCFSQCECVR